MQVLDPHRVAPLQRMSRPDRHDKALPIQRQCMEAIVEIVGAAEDRDIDLALVQKFLQGAGRRILEIDLDTVMRAHERGEQIDEPMRPDRAHQPDGQRRGIELGERPGLLTRLVHLPEDLAEVGLHDPPKLGQVRVAALPMNQRTAELAFQVLDGPGQGRLRDVAALGGTCEVERVTQGDEIANFLDFHGADPSIGLR